ncbi:MAG: hypothetical protein MJZ20_02800 [Bacteroidaceae bacterium]|nr:hypothetical protein [Bacteroidaceae bacterium]
MITDQEFRKKYMYELPDYGGCLYDISVEERNRWSEQITKEVYIKYRNIWLKQKPEERVLEDDLTFGQYKTYVALLVVYGLGYYRHSPIERFEHCDLWNNILHLDKAFDDYDWFVDKSKSEMDKRFIEFIKRKQDERKKYIDFFAL